MATTLFMLVGLWGQTADTKPATLFYREQGKAFFHRAKCPFIRNVPDQQIERVQNDQPQSEDPEDRCRPCPVCCSDMIDRPLARIEPPRGVVRVPDEVEGAVGLRQVLCARPRCPMCGQALQRQAGSRILRPAGRSSVVQDRHTRGRPAVYRPAGRTTRVIYRRVR